MRGSRVFVAALVGSALLARSAVASILLLPTLGARDGAMLGNNVASAGDAASVLMHNPAGVTELPPLQTSLALFQARIAGRYTNPDSGYDGRSAERALAPSVWVGPGRVGEWSLGLGLYGAVGASFNFPANAAAGAPNRFLTELSTIHLGLTAGRELTRNLRLGLQLAPTYGSIRTRTPSPLGPVRFDIGGPGLLGVLGLLYDLDPETTLGVQYRSPGFVWMDGDADVGPGDDEVEMTFHIPQQVSFGIARRIAERVLLSLQARWADYSQMADGRFEFDRNPALDRPFITDGRGIFRFGAGAEIDLTEHLQLRFGISREEWMIAEDSLTPLLYDISDVLFGAGLGARFGRWKLDLAVGSSIMEDRVATAGTNPFFPGRYQVESEVFALGVSYGFGGD